MLKIIDRLAGLWLDWRMDQESVKNPVMKEFDLKKAEFDENGFHAIASFPGIAILADEAANMLTASSAKNYLEFDMMPRLDRGLRPIRVTVQWAEGESPAAQAEHLRQELESLKNEISESS